MNFIFSKKIRFKHKSLEKNMYNKRYITFFPLNEKLTIEVKTVAKGNKSPSHKKRSKKNQKKPKKTKKIAENL